MDIAYKNAYAARERAQEHAAYEAKMARDTWIEENEDEAWDAPARASRIQIERILRLAKLHGTKIPSVRQRNSWTEAKADEIIAWYHARGTK